MNNNIEEFDFNISSVDEITNNIDDDILDTILDEHGISHDKFGQTLDQFNDTFLDTLKDSNNQNLSTDNAVNAESTFFDTKEKEILSNIADNLDGVDQSFNPFNVEPLPSINQFFNTPQAKVQKPKIQKKKRKKRPNSIKYRDLSMMTDEQARLNFKSMVGRSQDPFPVKLHKIIDRIESNGFSSIISWCPHGRAFKIHDNNLFEKEVMSRYFYQTKMSSFTRQLGMSIDILITLIILHVLTNYIYI